MTENTNSSERVSNKMADMLNPKNNSNSRVAPARVGLRNAHSRAVVKLPSSSFIGRLLHSVTAFEDKESYRVKGERSKVSNDG